MAEAENQGQELSSHDPFRNMERSDIRPDFNPIKDNSPAQSQKDATTSLKNSEAFATHRPNDFSKNQTSESAQDAEKSPDNSLYTGEGKSKSSPFNKKGKSGKFSIKAIIKRRLPTASLLIMLVAFGFLATGSQFLMPFAIVSRIVDDFNSISTVNNKRSDSFMNQFLKQRRFAKDYPLLFDGEKFGFTKKQSKKLKQQGIETGVHEANGKKTRYLIYKDADGQHHVIVGKGGDGADALAHLKSQNPSAKYASRPVDFDSFYMKNSNFRNKYIRGSKGWRGNSAGWYDNVATSILKRLGVGRNRWNSWDSSADAKTRKEQFLETSKKYATDVQDGGTKAVNDDPENQTEEGNNKVTELDSNESAPRSDRKKLIESFNSKATKAAKGASAADLACQILAAFTAIQTLVAAQQHLEQVNLISGFTEATQKTKYGEGNNSPIADYANGYSADYVDKETGKNLGSAIGTVGLGMLFGDKSAKNPGADPYVKELNSQGTLLEVMGKNLGLTADSYLKCMYTSLTAATLNTIVAVTGVFSGGLTTIAWEFIKSIGTVLIVAAVTTAITALATTAATYYARQLINEELAGPFVGAATTSAGNKYLGAMHQGSGGTGGNEKVVFAFRNATQEVLAETARYERETLSPFDISSKNTFFGSIFNNLATFSSSSNSFVNTLSSLSSIVSSSIVSTLPTASAVAETRVVNQRGDCPILKSIDMTGDAYCNPYQTSDMSTIDDDALDVYYEALHAKAISENGSPKSFSPTKTSGTSCSIYKASTNFKLSDPMTDLDGDCWIDAAVDENNNPIINPYSELGAFASVCGQRSSVTWGYADAGVATIVASIDFEKGEKSGVGELASNGIVNATPAVGDIAAAKDAMNNIENVNWINGQICVNSPQNKDWPRMKRYQRYYEDQRWFENAGFVEKSQLTAVLEQNEKDFPLDKSYEGTLARLSGMTKDEVIATLDFVEDVRHYANYDSSNLAPLESSKDLRYNIPVRNNQKRNNPWQNYRTRKLNTQIENFSLSTQEKSHFTQILAVFPLKATISSRFVVPASTT